MPRLLAVSGALLGTIAVVAAAAVGIGRCAWDRGTSRALSHLEEVPRQHSAAIGPTAAPAALVELPPPVARYLRFARATDRHRWQQARVTWTGELRMRPDAQWVPFSATQHFSIYPPGFIWDARVRMMPLVSVRVRDGYRAGQGTMLGRVAAVIPVVDEGGTPEMAQSALARWLGEAVWFPSALLPGGPVRWDAVDDSTARATVTDGAVSASAYFHFAPAGEITRMTALRYRDVDGRAVLTPFEGRLWEYTLHAGVMVPLRAEVAWLLPEGRYAYWRGTPQRIEYGTGREAER